MENEGQCGPAPDVQQPDVQERIGERLRRAVAHKSGLMTRRLPAPNLAYLCKPTEGGPREKMRDTKESLIKIKADRKCKSMKMQRLLLKASGSKPISPLELKYKADQSRSIETNKRFGMSKSYGSG